MSTSNLIMNFSKFDRTELISVSFTSAISGRTQLSVRGKSSGAYRGAGTFQWTTAVRALSALVLRSKLNDLTETISPMIEGPRQSLASSLDFAISKGPIWMAEMFGFTANGALVAKRLFSRSNSNLKRAGPVALVINRNFLPADSITILNDNREVTSQSELEAVLLEIEAGAHEGSIDFDGRLRQALSKVAA